MFQVFLQNLVLILVTSLALVYHRADYTLFMAIVAILVTSIRIIFKKNGLASAKISYFLFQGFVFSLVIWYVLNPRQFSGLYG